MRSLLEGKGGGPSDVERHLERCVGANPLVSRLVIGSTDYRRHWIAYHLAQFCVNNKLKTPLGKPQDTLTTIEKALRNSNQILSTGQSNMDEAEARKLRLQCKDLLVFYEMLEKSMHNAWDGSAYHLNPRFAL